MNTLEEQWRIYFAACYPQGCPSIQEFETRQAFFAGCLIVLKHAVEASASMGEEKAFRFIGDLILEAQTVCRNRTYALKGKN